MLASSAARAAPSVARMSDTNSLVDSIEPGEGKLAAYDFASASLRLAVKPAFIAGFGRNASANCAADPTGGVPKMTKPAAPGSGGAASSNILPPRLPPQ